MFKKSKKLFSVILSLCMVLSMFLGSTISVDAADKAINCIKVTEVPVVEFGVTEIADAKVTIAKDEGFEAESYWLKWDETAGDYVIVNEGVFTTTDIYFLRIAFRALEGYEISDDFYLDIAGERVEEIYGAYDENEILTYYYDFPVCSARGAIHEIEITSPEVKVGAEASVEKIGIRFYGSDLSPIEDGGFEIESKWICTTCNYEDVTGKEFEDGHAYELCINIDAGENYLFADTLVVDHNGEIDDFEPDTPTNMKLSYNYSLLAPLEEIELAGLPSVKVGETMVEELEVITPVEDYDCEIFVYWWDEEGNDTAGSVMEAGHTYTLQIEANLSGYTPIGDNFVFVIDGTTYEPTELLDSQAYLEFEYDLSEATDPGDTNKDNNGNVLDKIIINGLPEVKAGETMATEASYDIENLPEDAVVYIEWYDENGNVVTGNDMENGHVYTASIEVKALYGDLTLSDDFVFVINGTEYEPTVLDENNDQPLWAQLDLEYDLSDASAGNSDTPKTGDSSMMMVWTLLALASMGTIVFARKRSK